MNCTNCGAPLRDGEQQCSTCGKELFPGRKVYTTKKRKRKNIFPVIIIVVLVIVIALCGVYLAKMFTNGKISPASDTIPDSKELTVCRQCKAEFEGKSLLCGECLSKTDESYYSAGYWCEGCITDLDKTSIALVDNYGYVYCESCNTGNYCKKCHSPLNNDDDDDTCSGCAKYFCAGCDEVLEYDEVVYEKNGEYFCEKCAVSSSCIKCNRTLEKGDDDELCFLCADYVCIDCSEVLGKNEGYTDKFGDTYCKSCAKYYSDNTCAECGDAIDESDDDSICWICADHYCCNCYEVITREEIVKKDEIGVYCADCQ